MLDYRNILRVGSDPNKSMRTMELELRSSHHTIRKVLDAAERAGIRWPLPENCTNEVLMELLFPEERQKTDLYVLPDYPYIHAELARKGVNLTMLWEEYCRKCQSEGNVPYMYTQYCEKYRQWARGMPHVPASAKRMPIRSARALQSRAKARELSMSCGLGTHSPKDTGSGAISRILLQSREMPERNRSSLPMACSGLRPWSRSLVPSMMISRSVSAGKEGAEEGISRPFCPMLEIVHPVSAARISTHRQSAS